MALLSVHVCEDSIIITDEEEEKAIGRLMKDRLHPVGLHAFLQANYNLAGSVNYQSWLSGVLAGAVLILGPPALPSEDQTAAATADPDPELLPDEIIVPGHTVHNGEVVQSPAEVTAATPSAVVDDLAAYVDAHPHKFAPGGDFAAAPAAKADEIEPAPAVDELTGDGTGQSLAPIVEPSAPAPEASGSGSP